MDDEELLERAKAALAAAGGPRTPPAPESMRGVRGYAEPLTTLLSSLDAGGAPPPPLQTACGACGGLSPFDECPPCYADRHNRQAVEAILRVHIPEGFRWAKLGAPEFERRMRIPPGAAARVLERVRVTLRGPPKAGKTALAVACFRAYIEGRRQGWREALFADARKLGVASTQWGMGKGEAPAVARAIEASLLVIDDLGNEEVPDNFACLGRIIHERHKANRRTWVTTGLTPEEVQIRYGAAIRRRLFVADGEPGNPLLCAVELGS